MSVGRQDRLGLGATVSRRGLGKAAAQYVQEVASTSPRQKEPSFPWRAKELRHDLILGESQLPHCWTFSGSPELLSGIPAQRHVLHTLGNTSLYQFISISLCITLKWLRSSSIGIQFPKLAAFGLQTPSCFPLSSPWRCVDSQKVFRVIKFQNLEGIKRLFNPAPHFQMRKLSHREVK